MSTPPQHRRPTTPTPTAPAVLSGSDRMHLAALARYDRVVARRPVAFTRRGLVTTLALCAAVLAAYAVLALWLTGVIG